MKNVNSYSEDSFEFYKKVVAKKQNSPKDPTYKARIHLLATQIEALYQNHTTEFKANNLRGITSYGYINPEKADLIKLYSYRLSIIQKLKVILTTRDNNIEDVLCPYCTINDVNTLDHILPKTDYPEFSVNPKNLFPMCSECNGYKSDVQGDVSNLFLNLYLDELPDKEFLYVSVDSNLKATFIIDNRNGIDPAFFQIIESHYQRLYLCDRFSKRASKVVDKLRSTIKPYIGNLDFDIIKKNTISCAKETQGIYGLNFWESILEIALINSQDFIDRCLPK